MDYHIHFNDGKDAVLPLEELQRRRKAGQLTGQEFVWREGMANWQALDYMLGMRGIAPPPQKVSPWLFVVAILAVLGLASFVGVNAVKGFRTAREQALARLHRTADQERSDAGVAAASKPIVQNSHSLTQTQTQQRAKAFRIRQYVDAYNSLGDHSQPWDADAKELLADWIASNYGGPSNVDYAAKVRQLADKLAGDRSCNDGIVLLAEAAASVDFYDAAGRYERAEVALEGSPYKGYPRFYAAVSSATHQGQMHKRDRASLLDEEALRDFKKCLTDGSIRPEDQPELAEVIINGWANAFFGRHREAMCRMADEAGSNYAWLAGLLRGRAEIDLGWAARGSGWGNTVAPDAWKKFGEHMKKARAALTAAWRANTNWPEAPTEMITVTTAQDDADSARVWFDRATAAQVDYPGTWSNMRWALLPRWRGSVAALEALGIEAVNSGRFDTDVPRKFMDCITDIESEENTPPGCHIYSRPHIWSVLDHMYQGYVKAHETEPGAAGWRSPYIIVAHLAGHDDIARQQLESNDWKIPDYKLDGWGLDLSLLPLEVAARTGSLSGEIQQAENLYEQGQTAAAGEAYKKLAPRAGDDRTRQFIQHRIAAIAMEKDLESLQWVDFLPKSTNDLNWIEARGKVTVEAGGSVEIHSGHRGFILYSRVPVGPDFEMKGEFDVVQSSTGDFQAGMIMGLPALDSATYFAFRIKHNRNEGNVAAYDQGMAQYKPLFPAPVNLRHNTFDIRLDREGRAHATVNGTAVLKGVKYPGVLGVAGNHLLAGLGAYNDMNETVIRYSHVQTRRLK